MTLGRNDAAISPSFVDGLTLEGPVGHAGMSICLVLHAILYYAGNPIKNINKKKNKLELFLFLQLGR